MASNEPKGPGRKGAVSKRSQFQNIKTKLWSKRNTTTGKIIDNKTTGGTFKGVRKEK